MKHPDTLTHRPNPRERLPLVERLNDDGGSTGFYRLASAEPVRQFVPCVTNDAEAAAAAAAPPIDWPSEHLDHYPETVVMTSPEPAKPKKPPRARKGAKKKPTT